MGPLLSFHLLKQKAKSQKTENEMESVTNKSPQKSEEGKEKRR